MLERGKKFPQLLTFLGFPKRFWIDLKKDVKMFFVKSEKGL